MRLHEVAFFNYQIHIVEMFLMPEQELYLPFSFHFDRVVRTRVAVEFKRIYQRHGVDEIEMFYDIIVTEGDHRQRVPVCFHPAKKRT